MPNPETTLGTLTPTDPAKVLAKAAEKLGVPVPLTDEARLMRVAYAICGADGTGSCDCRVVGQGSSGCCNDIRDMAIAAIAAYEAP